MIKNINVEDTVIMLSNDYIANKEALKLFAIKKQDIKKRKVRNEIGTREPMTMICLREKRKNELKETKKTISKIKKDNKKLIKEIRELQKQMY